MPGCTIGPGPRTSLPSVRMTAPTVQPTGVSTLSTGEAPELIAVPPASTTGVGMLVGAGGGVWVPAVPAALLIPDETLQLTVSDACGRLPTSTGTLRDTTLGSVGGGMYEVGARSCARTTLSTAHLQAPAYSVPPVQPVPVNTPVYGQSRSSSIASYNARLSTVNTSMELGRTQYTMAGVHTSLPSSSATVRGLPVTTTVTASFPRGVPSVIAGAAQGTHLLSPTTSLPRTAVSGDRASHTHVMEEPSSPPLQPTEPHRVAAFPMPFMGQIPHIPRFSGEGQASGESFSEWHEHFNNIATLVGWDDHWKLVHLTSSLRDTAMAFYRSCGVDVRSNYKSLVAAMKQRFTPIRHRGTWRECALTQRITSEMKRLMDRSGLRCPR